jgi:hypothetical protein
VITNSSFSNKWIFFSRFLVDMMVDFSSSRILVDMMVDFLVDMVVGSCQAVT